MSSVFDVVPPAHKVRPYLWIGDMRSISDKAFLKKNKIQVVINCTPSLPFADVKHKYQLSINDDLKNNSIINMAQALPAVVSTMIKHIKNKETILVHCHAGMQRSAAVVAAYLIASEGLNKQKAIQDLQRKRWVTFRPSANFDRSLTAWEQYIKQKKRK